MGYAIRDFGPLVMVGPGRHLRRGALRCVFPDLSDHAGRCRRDARRGERRGLLKGARGRKPASREAILDVLLKIGGDNGLLMQHADDIREADINPLIVSAVRRRGRRRALHPRIRPRNERRRHPGGIHALVQTASRCGDRCLTKARALPNVFIRRLREFGFEGEIYPDTSDRGRDRRSDRLRPRGYTGAGRRAYIAIGAAQIPPMLASANGRLRFAQVISSGFGEVEEGRELQAGCSRRRAQAARAHRPELSGPLYSARQGHFAEIGAEGCRPRRRPLAERRTGHRYHSARA